MKIWQRLIRLWRRLMGWAEVGGRIWAAYWLLILGSFFIVGSVVLRWIMFPFSRNVSGLRLPLLGLPAILPRIHLLSYGVAALAILALGFFLRKTFKPSLALAAALLLTLWTLLPARIAFEQSALLRRLTEEDQAVPVVRGFANIYLPLNFGTPQAIPKHLDLVTFSGRFMAAVSFLGLGWYCLGFGSLLVAVYGLGRLPGERTIPGLAIVGLPLAALAILSLPPLIGQHYFDQGSVARAAGLDEDAIAAYRKAMKWDSWHAEGIEVYNLIGQMERQAGIAEGSPERAINRAVDFQAVSQYEPAIFELEHAAEAGGAIGLAARHEAALTRVDLGLACYHGGAIGPAVTNWQLALAEDPFLVYALPYLGRANYDLGRYEAALDVVAKLIKINADHDSLLANAYSLGADAYAKMGRDEDARHYYALSLTIDPVENHWALTGLVGE